MLYILALTTGLRASELHSLLWRSLSLSESEPCVTVLAGYAKNRSEATLPLRKHIAQQFRRWLAEGSFSPDDKVFAKFNKRTGAAILRADLKAAGVDYVDAAGRYAGFHALRHSTGSLRAASGVHPKVAQSIMRHSDINLTMSTYTHTYRG